MLTKNKLCLNAVLLGSLCIGGAAMADKDEDAARARDKAEKAADKAAVSEAKAVEKENKAERSRRRHGGATRTRVIERQIVEQPAPAPAPEVNVHINND